MTTTEYTFCDDTISDLHKDAYGFRPGQGFWQRWQEATDDQKQEEWDWLIQVLDQTMKREAEMQKEAIAKFEFFVDQTIECGAGDRQTALQWIMDASTCNGDWEFLCYHHDLPYGYFKL